LTTRSLGAGGRRPDTGAHPSFAANSAKETGFRLFDDFNVRVPRTNTEVLQGAFRGLFN
jgi:D-Tyr-tRNAtyr deacylase